MTLNVLYFIYLARCDADYLKIGISTCPEMRMRTLRQEWASVAHLIDSFPGSYRLEKVMHSKLDEHRVRGEWYWDVPQVVETFALAKSGGIVLEEIRCRVSDYRGNAKVTEQQVCEIRRRLANGEKQRLIAPDYGVSRSNIAMIATNASWRGI